METDYPYLHGWPQKYRSAGMWANRILGARTLFVIDLLEEEDLSFLAICETWLIGEIASSFGEIPGFYFLTRDVEGSVRKRGVGLYVKNIVELV